jgi:hypothetical protein
LSGGKSVNQQLGEQGDQARLEMAIMSGVISGYGWVIIKKQIEFNRLVVNNGGDTRRIPKEKLEQLVGEQEELLRRAEVTLKMLGFEEE